MSIVFGVLVQLAILGAIVFAIVNAVRGRGEKNRRDPRSAVSVRRLFQYLLLLVALVVAAFGVGGLLARVISDAAARRGSELAGPLALTVVGVPVFWLLGRWIWQQLQTDPAERDSVGWSLYVNTVLVGSLLTAAGAAFAIADELIGGNGYEGTTFAAFLVASAVWSIHWIAWRRIVPAAFEDLHVLAGSAIGLAAMASGAGFVIGSAIDRIFVQARDIAAASFVNDDLAMSLVSIGIGVVVWAWHWLYNGLRADRTTLWHTYVILIGIFGGLVTFASGGATALFLVLQWTFGDPDAISAAAHFQDASPAFAASIIGLAMWFYHKTVLSLDLAKRRTDIDRIYDYLVSGVALVIVAGALTTLIVAVLSVLGPEDVVANGGSDVDIVIAAITLLLVGIPLWAVAWRRAQCAFAADAAEEGSSAARRVYLFAVLGLGGAIAFGALTRLVFVIFEAVLGERSGGAVYDDIQIPFALLATTGAVAAYHWSIHRAGRNVEQPTPWRDVTLVWAGGETGEIEERAHVRVRAIQRIDTTDTQPVSAIVAAIDNAAEDRLVVVVNPAGVDVIPVAGTPD